MALGVQNYNGGTTDEYGTNLVLDRFIGSGVVEGLLVQANATPNMTVYVQPGTVAIATGTYPSSYNYRAHIDTALPGAAVTVGTAAASPRIDYIVAYTDKTVAGSTAGANVNNTNAVLKLADVQGTPAGSPSVPTVAQIQSTIGASNPYFILAQIAVGASVSTITNTNITDLRSFVSPANSKAFGASSYVDNGGIGTFTASTLNGSFTAGLAYINVSGVLVPQSFNILSYTATASQDSYFYVVLGNSTIQKIAVANNAASPTLPANAVWLGIVVSGASAITSVNQGQIGAAAPVVSGRTLNVSDSNGLLIYPTPLQRDLAYAQSTTTQNTGAVTTAVAWPGLAIQVQVPSGGRRIKLTAYISNVLNASGTGTDTSVLIQEGASVLQSLSLSAPNNQRLPIGTVSATISATAGLHTYTLQTQNSVATNIAYGASATAPAFIKAEQD